MTPYNHCTQNYMLMFQYILAFFSFSTFSIVDDNNNNDADGDVIGIKANRWLWILLLLFYFFCIVLVFEQISNHENFIKNIILITKIYFRFWVLTKINHHLILQHSVVFQFHFYRIYIMPQWAPLNANDLLHIRTVWFPTPGVWRNHI